MKWFQQWRESKRERRVADLQAELDAANRKLAVAEAEIETMAAVIARDRARIHAETAVYGRQQAQAEGLRNVDCTDESIRRFSA